MKKKVCKKRCIVLVVLFFTISLTAFTKKASAADNYEVEDNNQISAATSVKVNEKYCGSISGTKDADYYTFDILENGYFNIDFSTSSIDTENLGQGWNVDIYNGEGLIYSIENIKNTFKTTDFSFPIGSKIYIRIKPAIDYDLFCPTNIEYTICVNYMPSDFWEQENNDSKTSANKINVNSEYYGNVQRKDDNFYDEDYYVFKTASDGYFNIDAGLASIDTEDVEYGWKIDIYNNDTLAYSGDYKKSLKTTNLGFTKGTTVYIKIYPSMNYGPFMPVGINYKLKVNFVKSTNWEKEFNDSKGKASSISADKKFYGNILSTSDVDYFKFKAAKTGTVNLLFGAGSIDYDDIQFGWNVTVSINNKSVYSGTKITNVYKKLKSFKVKKGDSVYIKVTPNYIYNCPMNIDYAVNVKYN